SALPAEVVRSRARLCLAQAVFAHVGGRLEAVEPLLADAESALAASGDEPYEPSAGRALSVLANVPAAIAVLRAGLARMRGDAARAVACDHQALEHLGEEDRLLRTEVAWNLAAADWLRGRLGPAERGLAQVVAEQRAAGSATWRCGWATSSAGSSAPKAVWARRCGPTSRSWRSPAK